MKNILLIATFLFVACSAKEKNSVNYLLDPTAFSAKVAQGATLIDVRTVEEYAEGHIEGALNLDINNAGFEENVKMLDPKKEYVVYCASGVRSGKAADIMRKDGFTSVYTLSGGIKTWKEKGLPLE
jgi:rhodanese-related sulfurtransferase